MWAEGVIVVDETDSLRAAARRHTGHPDVWSGMPDGEVRLALPSRARWPRGRRARATVDIRTGIRAYAIQRGQCSTANQRARGRMLSPQRGQTRSTASSSMRQAATGSGADWRPAAKATAAASARVRTPSFSKMLPTWNLTVCGLRKSSSAISRLR